MPLNLNTDSGPRSSPISYAEERKTYPDSLSAQTADGFRQDFKIWFIAFGSALSHLSRVLDYGFINMDIRMVIYSLQGDGRVWRSNIALSLYFIIYEPIRLHSWKPVKLCTVQMVHLIYSCLLVNSWLNCIMSKLSRKHIFKPISVFQQFQ